MNELSRREFSKSAIVGTFALSMVEGAAILTSGCSESDVMTDIKNWEPAGKEAFDSIATILIGANVIPAGFAAKALIDDLFDQLGQDAAAYLAITPPPVGALADVEATFTAILTNLQNFLAGLALSPGNLLSLIVDLADIVVSTIEGFEGDLPASMKSLKAKLKSMLGTSWHVGARSFEVSAVHRTRRQFKRDFNAEARAGKHPEAELPLSFFERF